MSQSHPATRWTPSHWSLQARLSALATAMAGGLLLLAVVAMYAAAPARHVGATTVALLVGLILGPLLGLPLVALVVWHVVKRALRPVRAMTSELELITENRGARRVTVPDSHDDVAELARAVNVTLRRMEYLGERQRAWVADASHELRSPLTGLRTQLEAALEHPEDEDWPRVARAALADADRLQRIIQDLLVMAKLEAGVLGERERLDLGELVRAETARRARLSRVPIEVQTDEGVVGRARPPGTPADQPARQRRAARRVVGAGGGRQRRPRRPADGGRRRPRHPARGAGAGLPALPAAGRGAPLRLQRHRPGAADLPRHRARARRLARRRRSGPARRPAHPPPAPGLIVPGGLS
jgi:signal transduction histidine kinase